MDFVIFAIGATGYSVIEYLFRGYTHWSMALTGGACLLVFYYYTKDHMQALEYSPEVQWEPVFLLSSNFSWDCS
ncbi:MAG: hypothetical protein V8Q42_12985 [Anaerovoracaceae bacterium]